MSRSSRYMAAALIFFGVVLSTALALAATDPDWGIELPPPGFEGEAFIPVIEVGIDLFEVNRVCHELGVPTELRVWGCAITEPRWCLIFVPRGAPQSFIAVIRRHERGHCNGWRHE